MYNYIKNNFGEKVYYHQEFGMRFVWMKPEDLKPELIKNAMTPMKHYREILNLGYNILGFSVSSSSEWSASKTKVVIEKDDILYNGKSINDIKTKGFNYNIGKYDNHNYKYYISKKSPSIINGIYELKNNQPNIFGHRTKLNYVCKKYGHIGEMEICNIISGQGCSMCKGEILSLAQSSSTKKFIENSVKIHGNLYDYSKVSYKNSQTPVEIICKKHNESFWKRPNLHIHKKQGCPLCSVERVESVASTEITNFLIENKIKFNKEQTFSDCKNKNLLRFDFYLTEYDVCIEFDGKQHFEQTKHWGCETKFLETQNNDLIKNLYCCNNNIILFRLRYDEQYLFKLNEFLHNEGIL